ncbi:MAG: hypothetical protein EAZ77_01360 [Nostocales cyanobacterium]|nr:MAG: hypothetical protein EAZ77_01360 [Nostocales cyanobacterium]
MGLMILPMCLSNSTLGFGSSNLLLFQYVQHRAIAHNSVVTNADFQLKIQNIGARDDQTEDCLRLGICKD